jgi:hypothetical protein
VDLDWGCRRGGFGAVVDLDCRAFGDLVPGESSVRRFGSRRVRRSAWIWIGAVGVKDFVSRGESEGRVVVLVCGLAGLGVWFV